ncbi:hypothetical protein [Francisella adeliensis]|uniref:Uncharacterized protein n=1 Tax=Francisella adeliensis TaxID=2007306 RepID=A0A2Z4XY19_9GAMM|nr:hypothetical protein [Francisella adeliensis]AXA33372.1 hypothetical protein CDH04_02615 [Francisella adeliensis]MBK2085387.1 hypothetical protein [Francisella adeliensis]MBK2097117.1 hypothetical protein [Francisella adeliensis]QIW11600.1 hypothetical protein FZC43_02615 [Francisella adeliensis]QIW13475.1 hypothetical protein FZC44_02615 [Francisella adeliensis]
MGVGKVVILHYVKEGAFPYHPNKKNDTYETIAELQAIVSDENTILSIEAKLRSREHKKIISQYIRFAYFFHSY